MEKAPAWHNPAEPTQAGTRFDILLLIITAGLICTFAYFKAPSLVKDLRYFFDAPTTDTRLYLTNSSRLALNAGDLSELQSLIREVSRLPHILGIIIANKDNRIVAGSWLGEDLSDHDAMEKTIQEGWQRWPVEGNDGIVGYVSVAFDEGVYGRMKAALLYVTAVTVAGCLVLLVLAARSFRHRLAREVTGLSQATTRIACGDFSARVPYRGSGAVAKLGQGFNRMAQDLDVFTRKLRTSEERFELAVNGSNDGIWDWDIQSNRLYLSPRFRQILGYADHELPALFTAWKRLIHPEDEPRVTQALEKHIDRNEPFRCEFRLKTRSGKWLWMLGRGQAVRDGKDTATRMAGSLTDISEQKAVERALAQEKERAQVTLHSIADGVITTDAQGRIDYMNPKAEQLTGRSSTAARGCGLFKVFDITDAERRPIDETALRQVLDEGLTAKFSERSLLRNPDGSWYAIEENAAPLREHQSEVTGMVVVFHDITQRQKLWAALQKEREQALVTLQSIGDGVITTDVQGRVVYMNPTAERLTGWPCSEAQQEPLTAVFTLVDKFGVFSTPDSMKRALIKEQAAMDLGQARLLSRTGGKYVIEHNVAPLRDKTRKIIGGVLVIHNVTERHKLMQQLSYQASHDPLTHLINRYAFELRLEKTLESAMENDAIRHMVCYMDLDQFKIVNDTCGHSAGDELLRQIATLIQEQVRQGDTLARLGGDEFGLLLESCALDNAAEIAENIRRSVEAFRFAWGEKTFSISISIGIAPINGGPGSMTELLSSVDQACYIAKSRGRNQIHVYQPGDTESSRWHREMQWVPHIQSSLDEGRFVLFAQPIVPIRSEDQEADHYEILVRMKDDKGKIIVPGAFLPAAERYGLMPTLDRWVVGNAIEMLTTAWERERPSSFSTFGVNISGAVLSDNAFLKYVKQTLERYELPPHLLCFEITETVAIANFSRAIRFVNELKDIGCRFALDDFGSGFASFSNLKTLPVDYLKIDGSFVRPLLENPVDYAMVEVINHIGHVMGLKTIAEFVETREILDSLHELGVDYAQGYFLGKPVPLYNVCYGHG